VFLLVKMVNRIKEASEKPEDAAEEEDTGPTELEVLLEIRDSLKKG
jgi:large conductance mechanosensitive channel